MFHVYLMDHAGSDVRRIASSVAASKARPNWSPDGTQLAFVGGKEHSPPSSTEYAYIAEPHNDRLENLGRTFTPPEWSPDGKSLAFIRWSEGIPLLVLATFQDSVRQDVSKMPTFSLWESPQPPRLVWFPNHSKFLFTRYNNRFRYDTYIIDPAQPDPPGDNSEPKWFGGGIPSWSPDGTMVATRHNRGNPFLYTRLPDGSRINPLVAKGPDGLIPGSEWRELEKTKAASTPKP